MALFGTTVPKIVVPNSPLLALGGFATIIPQCEQEWIGTQIKNQLKVNTILCQTNQMSIHLWQRIIYLSHL
jgi:hypothetical protein